MKKTSWAGLPERGSLRFMYLGIKIMNMFGYWTGLVGGFFAVLYFFLTGPTSRRASLDYLRHLYRTHPQSTGRPNYWKAMVHHWHFALSVVDRMWFWQGQLKHFKFTRQGREHLVEKRERGILLMGAHMGNVDAMRAFSLDKGLHLNVLMYRAHAQKINALFNLLNPSTNVHVIAMDDNDFNRVFELKEKVERGEIVALLGDRPPPRGRPRMTPISFLGEEALFPQNPWILASLLECPVYLAMGMRTGLRRYHIMVEPFADKVALPRKTRQESLCRYMERYGRRLEEFCVAYPYQWFNFYDFWNQSTERS